MKLRPKQKKFCLEYLKDLNATQAAIRAGYSEKTAGEMGSENLKKPHIAEHIAELQRKISEKSEISIQNMIKYIKEVADEARETGDFGNTLKGVDMLMKHLGGYSADNVSKSEIKINPIQIILDED